MSDHVAKAIQKVTKALLPAWYLPNGTKYASDDQLEGASSSCEKWGLWCGVLVIASVIAEVIIAKAKPTYDLFLALSLPTDIGIAFGIIGEVLLGMRNNRLQTELRGRSDEKVATATARAAKALEELTRFRTPRQQILTIEVMAALKEKLLPFAGTPFCVGHEKVDREQWDFMWSLEPTLTAAGWQHVDWVGGFTFRKNGWSGNHTYGEMGVVNIELEIFPDARAKLLPAAKALAAALNDIGIDANIPISPNNSSINPGVIHLLVGMKQGPLLPSATEAD
jgi:hypothetical protein